MGAQGCVCHWVFEFRLAVHTCILDVEMRAVAILLVPLAARAAEAPAPAASTCGDIKELYRAEECCGTPSRLTHFQKRPMPAVTMFQNNYCANRKPIDGPAEGDGYFNNIPCRTSEGIVQALEQ